MSDPAATPVLVAGAGPVGLASALMLARHGVPVRIIDRDEAPTDLSKALVVWQRTLETFDPVLPHERFTAEHPILHGVSLGLAPGRTIDVELPARPDRPPPCVLIPQSATERILQGRLEELGVTVERRSELTGFTADATGVTCEITHPDGAEQLRGAVAGGLRRRPLDRAPRPGARVPRRDGPPPLDAGRHRHRGRPGARRPPHPHPPGRRGHRGPVPDGRWALARDRRSRRDGRRRRSRVVHAGRGPGHARPAHGHGLAHHGLALDLGLRRQRAPDHRLRPRPHRAGRRRRPHPQPRRRPGHEHRPPGRRQPRLEDRPGAARGGRPRPCSGPTRPSATRWARRCSSSRARCCAWAC